MEINKNTIINKHRYTALVYERINKKLGLSYSKKEIESLIRKILNETDLKNYKRVGKNFYISNKQYNIRVTINSSTYSVITVDLLK